jgi:RimJ/RimL family protein N-acetyltransferase
MTTTPVREPVTLMGSRVVLSIPGERDIDRIAELCRETEISTWTTVPAPYGRADAEGFVLGAVTRGWAQGTDCTWGIRFSAGGELQGMIGIEGIADGAAEIGYWLAPEARGRGLMSEAAGLAIDHAFARQGVGPATGLGLRRLAWHAFVGNAASASVARRAGFQFEGTRRLGAAQRGERLDDWQASLLHNDPREPAGDWPDETYVQRPPVRS